MSKGSSTFAVWLLAALVIIAGALSVVNFEQNQSLTTKVNQLQVALDKSQPAAASLSTKGTNAIYSNPTYDFDITIPTSLKAGKLDTGVKFGTKIDGYNAGQDLQDGYGVAYAANTAQPITNAPATTATNETVVLNGISASKATFTGSTVQLVVYTMIINGRYYYVQFEAAKSNSTLWQAFDQIAKSFKYSLNP